MINIIHRPHTNIINRILHFLHKGIIIIIIDVVTTADQ